MVQLAILKELLEVEESFLRQKLRIKCLREGDQNANYFYRVVEARISINRIQTVLSSDGILIIDEVAVRNEILGYFKGLLGIVGPDSIVSFENLQSLLPSALSDDMKEGMIAVVTKEEVYSIIKSLPSNKSPGPDGFIVEFFKSTWDITGDLVVEAVQEFFETGQLFKELNCMLVTLVSKFPHSTKVSNYRPISCCNKLYKCISKFLVNKLNACLPIIISKAHSAFTDGRKIVDNISCWLSKWLEIITITKVSLGVLLRWTLKRLLTQFPRILFSLLWEF